MVSLPSLFAFSFQWVNDVGPTVPPARGVYLSGIELRFGCLIAHLGFEPGK